jgi:hypothetical protein
MEEPSSHRCRTARWFSPSPSGCVPGACTWADLAAPQMEGVELEQHLRAARGSFHPLISITRRIRDSGLRPTLHEAAGNRAQGVGAPPGCMRRVGTRLSDAAYRPPCLNSLGVRVQRPEPKAYVGT